jgi:hypothetical protein
MRRAFLGAVAGLGLVGTSRKASARPAILPVPAAGPINVLDYGVAGDGTTDDWAALQFIVDNVAQDRGTIYMPARSYLISQTIECGTKAFNWRGDGRPQPFNVWLGGTMVKGAFAGPLLRMAYPGGQASISDMGFSNSHASGQALALSGSSLALDRVTATAYRAIIMDPNAFCTSMRDVQVLWNGWTAGSVGIAIRGHARIESADVVGFDYGIRACGIGNYIGGHCRIEVNRTGIQLGVDPAGTNAGLLGCVVEAVSMEANDTAIDMRVATCSSVRNLLIQGSVNSPSAGSKVGLVIANANACSFEGVISNGGFNEASIRILAASSPSKWSRCIAGNTNAAAKKWDYTPSPWVALEQCS